MNCEPTQSSLAELIQYSRSWNFESAQTLTHKLDARDPITAFEIMRMHELRGSILDALGVAKPLAETSIRLDNGTSTLFSLATAYFNCLHRGLWAYAITAATSCYTEGRFHTPSSPAPRTKVGNLVTVRGLPRD
jgi:hypothetical protein